MTLLRTESFVPLTTAPVAGERGEFRATIIPQTEETGAFQRLDTTAAGKICEPRVTVQREGNRIATIRVQCTCGQVTDLACVYEETPKPT